MMKENPAALFARIPLIALPLTALLLGSLSQVFASYPVRTVAMSDWIPAGHSGPVGNPRLAALGANGQVVFISEHLGGSTEVWFADSGGLQSIAESDSLTRRRLYPPVILPHRHESIAINGDGAIAFVLDESTVGVGVPGAIDWVRLSDPAPGDEHAGKTLEDFGFTRGFLNVHLSDDGALAIALAGGFWTNRSGVPELEYVNGDRVIIAGRELLFRTFPYVIDTVYDVDSGGRIARSVGYEDEDQNVYPRGLFVDRNEQIDLLATVGDIAPDAGGRSFETFLDVELNSRGDALVVASVPPVSSQISGEGLWVANADSNLRKVVLTGEPAPGIEGYLLRTLSFRTYASGVLYSSSAINDDGRAAFYGWASSDIPNTPIRRGFWVEDNSHELKLAAAYEEVVPGSPEYLLSRAIFADPIIYPGQFIAFNSEDQLATLAVVESDDLAPRYALLATNPINGLLSVVLTEGDTVEVANAEGHLEPREITALTLVGNDFFNDRGELLFHASFADGSYGLFVLTVPEPAGAVLAALLLGACRLSGASRRRSASTGNPRI